MIITIDGPTASGKSTLAKNIANELGIFYLNTGFLYRGLAYLLVNKFGYDEQKLRNPQTSDIAYILNPSKFVYSYDGNAHLSFEDKDISDFLKTPEIDNYSSIVSAIKEVRKSLLNFQREVAKTNDLVIEGRDTGSIVFPDADVKIYLTASIEVRAERWQKYMVRNGKKYSLKEAIEIISERDKRDKEREISPLVIPQGAVIIDSSNLNPDQLEEEVIDLIESKALNRLNNFQ